MSNLGVPALATIATALYFFGAASASAQGGAMPQNELSGPFRARLLGESALIDIDVKLVVNGEQIRATPASQADAHCPRGSGITEFLSGQVHTRSSQGIGLATAKFPVDGTVTLCTPPGPVFEAAIKEGKTAGTWTARFTGTMEKCLIEGKVDAEKWTADEKQGHPSNAKLALTLPYQHTLLLRREGSGCEEVPPANKEPALPGAGPAKAASQQAHSAWDDFWKSVWQCSWCPGGGQKR